MFLLGMGTITILVMVNALQASMMREDPSLASRYPAAASGNYGASVSYCGTNEELVSSCQRCEEETCQTFGKPNCYAYGNKQCSPSCRCKSGYVRGPKKGCIRYDQCNYQTPPPQCSSNEVYTQCGSACPRTCVNPNPYCEMSCVSGCFCTKGYMRNREGTCVQPNYCNQVQAQSYAVVADPQPPPPPRYSVMSDPEPQPQRYAVADPPPQPQRYAAADPPPQPQRYAVADPPPQPQSYAVSMIRPQPQYCNKEGEEFFQCNTDCEFSCSNYTSKTSCYSSCKQGCFCQKGLVRDNYRNCIEPRKCVTISVERQPSYAPSRPIAVPLFEESEPKPYHSKPQISFDSGSYSQKQFSSSYESKAQMPKPSQSYNVQADPEPFAMPTRAPAESYRPQPQAAESYRPQLQAAESYRPQPQAAESFRPQPQAAESYRPQPQAAESYRPQPQAAESYRPQPQAAESYRPQLVAAPAMDSYRPQSDPFRPSTDVFYTPSEKYSRPAEVPQCRENERYVRCYTRCPLTCRNVTYTGICRTSCRSGCFCKPGYVIGNFGRCVKKEECQTFFKATEKTYESQKSSKYQSAPIAYQPIAMPVTPSCYNYGEEYNSCFKGCVVSCRNHTTSSYCQQSYSCQKGCFCREGMVRNDAGSCVEPKQCPRLSVYI